MIGHSLCNSEYANQEPEAWDDFFEEVNDQEAPNELNQEELMDGHEAQNELNQEELMDEEVEAMEEELFDEDDDSETDEEHNPIDHANRMQYIYWWG